jgi:hypothetical protein
MSWPKFFSSRLRDDRAAALSDAVELNCEIDPQIGTTKTFRGGELRWTVVAWIGCDQRGRTYDLLSLMSEGLLHGAERDTVEEEKSVRHQLLDMIDAWVREERAKETWEP